MSTNVSVTNKKKVTKAPTPRVPKRRNRRNRKQKAPIDEKLVIERKKDIELPGQRSTVAHTVQSPAWVSMGPIIAWASEAAKMGIYATTFTPSRLYWAMAYAATVISDAQNGVTIKAQRLPYWLLCFLRALAPKSAKIESGMSSESYNLQADWGEFPTSVETVATYGYTWAAYIPAGPVGPNGFPAASLPAAYDPQSGEEAFGDVCSFMANLDAENKNHKLVPVATTTPWDSQMSAFSYPSLPEGTGFQSKGGIVYQSNLALPINSPMLGVFGCGASTDLFFDATRYPQYTTTSSGDSITAGYNMLKFSPRLWQSKKRCFYKPVDFLKIGEVAARWVTGLIQANFDGPVQQVTTLDPTLYQCPLTLQEFLLLLKNEVQCLFDSQTAVQSLYPASPSSSSNIQFVPYLNTPNTVPLGFVGMQMPLILAENLKSLAARYLSSNVTNDYMAWAPILGQYKNFALDPEEYVAIAIVQGVNTQIPAFRVDSALKRKVVKKDGKGKEVVDFMPEAEVPVDFVDGLAGSTYIFLNDPTRLRFLNEKFQDWLAKLNQYSSNLTTLSYDFGSNVLCSCAMTSYWQSVSQTEKAREADVLDVRGISPARIGSPYIGQRMVAVSSHAKIVGAAWGLAQNFWILPEIQLQADSVASLATFTRCQDIFREGNSVTYSSTGDNGVPIVDRLAAYAKMLVRGASAKSSELEIFFEDQHNRHGLLSSLAADLLGKALGPEVGAIAGAVANLFPI